MGPARLVAMPFTLSHTVAIVPFLRWRRLDGPALAIGSMAPDFGYFLHCFDFAARCHTASGALLWGLPGGFLVWWLVRFLAGPLTVLLPQPERSALYQALAARRLSASGLLGVVLSLALGIATHNFWDSFTHRTGWMVQHLPVLREPWPICRALQYASSVFGLALLAWYYFRWRAPLKPAFDFRSRPLVMLAGLALVAALLALPATLKAVAGYEGAGLLWVRALTFRWIVDSLMGFGILYLLLGWIRQSCDRRRPGIRSSVK